MIKIEKQILKMKNMKKTITFFGSILILISVLAFNIKSKYSEGMVYKCTTCCKIKTVENNNTPWESGCKSSSGMHNFTFVAHKGVKGIYCSKCKTEVYIRQDEGISASASSCCSDGKLCNWYNK